MHPSRYATVSYRHFTLALMAFTGLMALTGLMTLACSTEEAPTATAPQDDSTVVAKFGDRPITLDELHDWMKEDFIKKLEASQGASQAYEVRSDALKRMIDEELLKNEAAKTGITPKELLLQEMREPSPISDAEVRNYYTKNVGRAGGGPPYEQISDQLREFLEAQRDNEFRDLYLRVLRDEARVQFLMQPARVEVAATGASIWPADAPITILEFSDYECPYCQRAEPALWKLIETYPEQVRWVYRHFPLVGMHTKATGAAEATVCAQRQGRFWEMHRVVFANTRNLSRESLQRYAEQVGLDMEKFSTCMDEGEATEVVSQDLREGRAVGVTGTPAFFLNGIPFSGALPFEEFDQMVQEELSRIEAAKEDSP